MKTLLMVGLLMCVPLASVAAEQNTSLSMIVEQQTALRDDLAVDPQGLTPRQVGVIRKAQAEVFRLVEGKTSLDQLAINDKVRLENALEKINAQVVGTHAASGDKNVCWREKTTGSKTTSTRCGTQDEIDQAREGARGMLERPKICEGSCG